jgi:HK97 gp10 family phage protein
MSRVVVSVSGLRQLEAALKELPKATARNVLKRTLVKAGEPIAQRARENAPVRTRQLQQSIVVSPRIKNKVGNAEYAAAMRAGLGKAIATQAMRDARRGARASFAEMYVGPTAREGWYGHFVEFGTRNMAARPFMRPAWDSEQQTVLEIIKVELRNEIMKTALRIGKSKKSSADLKYRASVAAMMLGAGV